MALEAQETYSAIINGQSFMEWLETEAIIMLHSMLKWYRYVDDILIEVSQKINAQHFIIALWVEKHFRPVS